MNDDNTDNILILPEEVTASDILCGRDKRCFNHVANRRFRFLTALNLERYREAESRRAKTLVVHSLYHQILDSGGRFLTKKTTRDKDSYYTTVSDKTAREKISHALRDKFPLSSLGAVKTKLQEQRRGGPLSTRFIDETFVAANAVILQVKLPHSRHASDTHVEIILTAELDRMCNKNQEEHTVRLQAPTLAATTTIASPTVLRQTIPPTVIVSPPTSSQVSCCNDDATTVAPPSESESSLFGVTDNMRRNAYFDEFNAASDELFLPQLPLLPRPSSQQETNNCQDLLEKILTVEHERMCSIDNQDDDDAVRMNATTTSNLLYEVRPTVVSPSVSMSFHDYTETTSKPFSDLEDLRYDDLFDDDDDEEDDFFLPNSFSQRDCQDILHVLDVSARLEAV